MFPHLTRVYVTKIDSAPHSDVFFPDLDADPAWRCVSEFPAADAWRTYWKTAVDEAAVIWQQKSNNIHDLRGPLSGTSGSTRPARRQGVCGYGSASSTSIPEGEFDQVTAFYDLKHNPPPAASWTNIYTFEDRTRYGALSVRVLMTFNAPQQHAQRHFNQRSLRAALAANN